MLNLIFEHTANNVKFNDDKQYFTCMLIKNSILYKINIVHDVVNIGFSL